MARARLKETALVETPAIQERKKPQLDPRFIISIDGNEFVKYQGLLDLGHQKGIEQIDVSIVQIPTADNGHFAICRAVVTSKDGEVFSDIGDASPSNCSSRVSKHLLRLASTRAIARALRSFTNIGITCLEELADLSDVEENGPDAGKIRPIRPATTKSKSHRSPDSVPASGNDSRLGEANEAQNLPNPESNSRGNGGDSSQSQAKSHGPNSSPIMSEAQRRAILNLSKRRGLSSQDLEKLAHDAYGVDFEVLTYQDASSLIRQLQAHS